MYAKQILLMKCDNRWFGMLTKCTPGAVTCSLMSVRSVTPIRANKLQFSRWQLNVARLCIMYVFHPEKLVSLYYY